MANMIVRFEADYAFLNNSFPCSVVWEGVEYQSVEHAFQASKTIDVEQSEAIRNAPTPLEAYHLGMRVTLRPNWNESRFDVMLGCLRAKFRDPVLREKLLATGETTKLVNDTYVSFTHNPWFRRDRVWGMYDGTGENRLGELLMQIRKELKG